MKFDYYIHTTALYLAVERNNADIVQILLDVPNIDANIKIIYIYDLCKIFVFN